VSFTAENERLETSCHIDTEGRRSGAFLHPCFTDRRTAVRSRARLHRVADADKQAQTGAPGAANHARSRRAQSVLCCSSVRDRASKRPRRGPPLQG
jgi:hypothetical protein